MSYNEKLEKTYLLAILSFTVMYFIFLFNQIFKFSLTFLIITNVTLLIIGVTFYLLSNWKVKFYPFSIFTGILGIPFFYCLLIHNSMDVVDNLDNSFIYTTSLILLSLAFMFLRFNHAIRWPIINLLIVTSLIVILTFVMGGVLEYPKLILLGIYLLRILIIEFAFLLNINRKSDIYIVFATLQYFFITFLIIGYGEAKKKKTFNHEEVINPFSLPKYKDETDLL